MKKLSRLLALFCIGFFSITKFYAQSEIEIEKMLLDVREASYYDSTGLFQIGRKVLNHESRLNASPVVAEVYIYYGNHFFYTRNIERAREYFQMALNEAVAAKSIHHEILAKIRLAYIASETEDFSKIENELKLLTIQAAEIKDYQNIAEILNMRGILNDHYGNPKIAAKLYLEGLNLSSTHHLDYYKATFHNNLGLLKFSLNDIDNALLDFSEVIRIAKKINNQRLLSHAQLNLSLILVAQKNYKEANELFSEVIRYANTNNHPEELASAYANLANAYVDNKDHITGLQYLDSALNVLEKFELKDPLILTYLNKSQIMTELNKLKEAEWALKKADLLIDKNINNDLLAEFYYTWYELFNKKKDFQKAMEYHVKYTGIKENLQQKLNTKALEELQLKYNIQQKEIDLEKEKTKSLLLEKNHEREVYFRWIILAISCLFIFSTIAFFYTRYYKAIREQQEKLSAQLIKNTEEERSRIAKDLHDDIGQSLSILKSKFINKNQNENSEIISKEIERVIEQTREISKNLFPSYLEKIGISRAISGLSESVQNANNIECSFDVAKESDFLPSDTATHVFRIIQECLNNTIKHSKATALKITLLFEDDYFILTYLDNGIFKKINKKEAGIGLLSIRERSKIIKGNLTIDENNVKGFKLILKFKV